MRGFAARATVEQAWAWIDDQSRSLPAEVLPLAELAGRVLASDVVSRVDVPGFDRAMMDGFAVRAAETLGASAYNPLPLRVVGQVLAGGCFDGRIVPGEAVRIMTGAPLPAGADAVLPVEQTDGAGEVAIAAAAVETILALGEISPGKHVGFRGEDIGRATTALERGRRLRPQDLGLLSSIGVAAAEVVRRPVVRIVITGNELLPAGSLAAGALIADANGPMLAALVERDGGRIKNPGIVPDDPAALLAALSDDADVILVSGGSSVGQEDHAPMLLAEHGTLAIHGVAMRPSSPAGMGRLGSRIVFLLPGNPVSCLCAYDFFAGRAIRLLGGRSAAWPYRAIHLPLSRKLVSTVGRVDYARVKFQGGQVEPISISGASVLSSTTRADGFVVIPADSEGFPAGAEVEVFLYDEDSTQIRPSAFGGS